MDNKSIISQKRCEIKRRAKKKRINQKRHIDFYPQKQGTSLYNKNIITTVFHNKSCHHITLIVSIKVGKDFHRYRQAKRWKQYVYQLLDIHLYTIYKKRVWLQEPTPFLKQNIRLLEKSKTRKQSDIHFPDNIGIRNGIGSSLITS